jgi:hypothetical protein
MPKASLPEPSRRQAGVPPARRQPGLRVKLVLVAWLAATMWALWHEAPGVQAMAAAVCRGARP